MKSRYRLFQKRSGIFFLENSVTRKQESLRTRDKTIAVRFLNARNEAQQQPAINLQIAKAYLAATDENFVKRTWHEIMTEFVKTKNGKNRVRSERAVKEKSFDSIRDLQLLETKPEHFLRVLESGGVSTNNYLRRFHNFAVDMGWLPWPVMPKRQWPPIHYKEKRAITREEHELILSRETNQEMRVFLWCCWYLGGSQSDVAHLKAEDIDWRNQVVSFFRSKTKAVQIIRIGESLAETLRNLPQSGRLFPNLAAMDEKHRAARFQRACRRMKVMGISLHSYRYSWAERAKTAGYPERFAQVSLGHGSKAWARAYSRKALVTLPSLEEYEQKIVPLM
ncbi:MAG TPA: tyrosine-type recombinase/integrase [Verrucomicrobiae bacterium]|nr:tyrosine-type recombinase/integrase [Verrucomicrobiae bacterium]